MHMITISFILVLIALFLIVNSGTMPSPNRSVCNVLLIVAAALYVYGSYFLIR
jgi:hypothetical protein